MTLMCIQQGTFMVTMMAMAIVAPRSGLNALNKFLYTNMAFESHLLFSYFVYLLLHTDLTQHCIIRSKGCRAKHFGNLKCSNCFESMPN